eukprot:GHVP01048959.1.p1 GENE.GHVP01048959.1~~GHVP01048959.1.p1  ORF type:complete len:318 (+),score=57.44 GHVP01048959.1:383-1336(+)
MRISKIKDLIEAPELKERLSYILNGTINIEGSKWFGYDIDSSLVLPYLSKRQFKNISRLKIDVDISHKDTKGIKTINLGRIEMLYLSNKAFNLLPIMNLPDNPNGEGLCIDTETSEVNSGTVKEIGTINMGKVNNMLIYNKAFYILPNLKTSNENQMMMLEIDTKESEMNYKTLNGMDYIEIGRIDLMCLLNKAFYLLPKIRTTDGNEIDNLYIDAWEPDIDHIGRISRINIGSFKVVTLSEKATRLLLVMDFPVIKKIDILELLSNLHDCLKEHEIKNIHDQLIKLKEVKINPELKSIEDWFPKNTKVSVNVCWLG